MRIRLKRGKQEELLLKAKHNSNLPWKEIAKKLELNYNYLLNEIKNEETTLTFKRYKLLCKLAKENYNSFIELKLTNSWGQMKGGNNSKGNTKDITFPKKSKELAELCGIILGDGNLSEFKKGKKMRAYSLRIAGDSNKDREYLMFFVKPLIENLFKIKTWDYNSKRCKGLYINADGIKLVEFIKSIGIHSGNKIKNNQKIPDWILNNEQFLKFCIRGLFDTDGSVYRMSKQDPNLLRISIKSYIPNLYENILISLKKLKFNPHEVRNHHQICISKKKEIERFVNEVGFSNKKHLNRLEKFKHYSPMV